MSQAIALPKVFEINFTLCKDSNKCREVTFLRVGSQRIDENSRLGTIIYDMLET